MDQSELQMLVDNLPDPERDEKPPPVGFSEEDLAKIKADKAYERQFLNVKNDTEKKVKYVLKSLMGAQLSKDGDYITIAGGRQVWQKKIADYMGGIPHPDGGYIFSYIEVKGVSPGNNFQLSRLDRRTNPKQPSQHEKLTKAWKDGFDVWLALGFWDAIDDARPVIENRKGRNYKRWKKEDVELTIYVIPWFAWVKDILPQLKYRSLRQKDRDLIEGMAIYKEYNRWTMHPDHWLRTFKKTSQMSLF